MDQFSDFNIEFESNDIELVDFGDEIKDNISIDLCIICKKCNVEKDNKCLECLIELNKCKTCKIFCPMPNELYCSECKSVVQYEGINLTINQILDLPSTTFKSQQMNKHLEEIFDHYKMTNNLKQKLIKNVNEFKILLNQCKNKSPGEVFCILDGQRDFPVCSLLAKHADQLLNDCMAPVSESHKYRYVHAIAPFIYDIWNTTCTSGVLLCYYKDFGSLTSCPNNHKTLFGLWERNINSNFTYDLNDVDICNCIVCNKSIQLQSKKVRCKSCYGYVHKGCVILYGGGVIRAHCPSCNVEWAKDETQHGFDGMIIQ